MLGLSRVGVKITTNAKRTKAGNENDMVGAKKILTLVNERGASELKENSKAEKQTAETVGRRISRGASRLGHKGTKTLL